jgi:hypothetical protein
VPASPGPDVPPDDDRALVIRDGQESWTSAAGAARSGYTIVDLGDDWTPYIFAEHRGVDGQPLPNRYRRVFLGLANDTLDDDGEPLPAGDKNYLELYGIPPSLGVLRARFLEDEKQSCHDGANLAAMEAVETVSYVPPEKVKQEEKRIARLRTELEAARKKAQVHTLAELAAKDPKLAPKVKLVERRAAEKPAMMEVERRLGCEGMFKRGKHVTGIYDDAMRLAVRRFQQKHMIYESNYLRQKTMDALARAPLANDHQALLRVLRERVVAAAGVVEDGSADGKNGPPTYTGANGRTMPVRNLAEEMTQAAVEQLGLASPEAALAFFKRHSAADFRHLRAAVRLPALPEYYGPNMDLSIVIDRGDVWYDLPWDAAGVRHQQPRGHYPSFHAYVKYNDQRIPLVRWRTTIGGWRAEQASDGYEYYRSATWWPAQCGSRPSPPPSARWSSQRPSTACGTGWSTTMSLAQDSSPPTASLPAIWWCPARLASPIGTTASVPTVRRSISPCIAPRATRTAATACPTTWPSGSTLSFCATVPCASWGTNQPTSRASFCSTTTCSRSASLRAATSTCLSRPCPWTCWKARSRAR